MFTSGEKLVLTYRSCLEKELPQNGLRYLVIKPTNIDGGICKQYIVLYASYIIIYFECCTTC